LKVELWRSSDLYYICDVGLAVVLDVSGMGREE
jgi:hypothetical protein